MFSTKFIILIILKIFFQSLFFLNDQNLVFREYEVSIKKSQEKRR